MYIHGEYPYFKRELTVPHKVLLPIELYLPNFYVGVIRTPMVNTKNI